MAEELSLARSVWYDFLASLLSYPFNLADFESRLRAKVEMVAEAAEVLREDAGYDLSVGAVLEQVTAICGYPELVDFQSDYVARFDKPSPSHSLSPFESVHRYGNVNLPAVSELERLYLSYGLGLAAGVPEMADHAMVELAFMSFLALKEAEARGADQIAEADRYRRAQADFLQEHLLPWMPKWLGNLGEAADHPLLRGAAELGRLTLDLEADVLAAKS